MGKPAKVPVFFFWLYFGEITFSKQLTYLAGESELEKINSLPKNQNS